MGLSSLEFNFLYRAHQLGILPKNSSILEFGECETIGDFDAVAALDFLLSNHSLRNDLLEKMANLKTLNGSMRRYDEVKLIYQALFNHKSYAAIDLDPGPDYRIQQDLNLTFNLNQQFDVCINNGTSEHVFNQFNFFKAMHDHTAINGVMIHWTPCLGYHDHGFYNVQPGLVYDLAHANGYKMLQANLVTRQKMYDLSPHMLRPEIVRQNPDLDEALACVIMKKTTDAAFQVPLQNAFIKLDRFRQEA